MVVVGLVDVVVVGLVFDLVVFVFVIWLIRFCRVCLMVVSCFEVLFCFFLMIFFCVFFGDFLLVVDVLVVVFWVESVSGCLMVNGSVMDNNIKSFVIMDVFICGLIF